MSAPGFDRVDLGEKTDVEAVRALVDISGLKLIDVGCGPGHTSRELNAAGAEVLGLEPDPVQSAQLAAAPPPRGLVFLNAPAEALPVADGAADGVLFFRSLHHVPVDRMELAIAESLRALAPERGFLCVIEPVAAGGHFELMRPFHDETRIRAAAQDALARFAAPRFGSKKRYLYRQFTKYADFDALVARFAGRSFDAIRREAIETDAVRRLFAAARNPAGEYVFEQTMWLDLFRQPLRS